MGILNLIRKIYFNQKNPNQKYFLKFVYVFINAGIGWNFNILNVLCQGNALLVPWAIWTNDYQLNIKPCIYFYKTSYNACLLACVAVYQYSQQYFSYLTISQRR